MSVWPVLPFCSVAFCISAVPFACVCQTLQSCMDGEAEMQRGEGICLRLSDQMYSQFWWQKIANSTFLSRLK